MSNLKKSEIESATHQLLEQLVKREAPVIARMRRRFLKETANPAAARRKLKRQAMGPARKSEELLNYGEALAKSDYQITSYADGAVKMEFGTEVPESVRSRAKKWAEKRGLKLAEIGLQKSENIAEIVVYRKA